MLILYLVIFYLFVVWMAHLAAVTIFSNDFQNLLMGNTSVFSTGAFVAVEIYEFPGYGGSNLTGKVYLNVEKSSVAADSLNIRFFGLERSCIEYVEMVTYENETRMETRRAFQNADIITLPVGLPGKQGIEVPNGSFFLIEYHLEARLHRHGMLTWDVHNSIEVLLKDPPYNRIPTPVFLPPHSIPVMFMCCFNSGNMTLGIKLDSNNLVVNELARVGYELRNESTSRIKALEISLHQIIEFSAMGRQYIDTNEWARRRIDASELENVLPLTDKNAILPDRDGMLINSLANMKHFVELLIPFQCRSSFSGKLGFVRHYIRARIITPFGEENPEVDCPVYVHNTAVSFVGVIPAVRQPFTRPVNWQPMNQAAPVFLNPPIESRAPLNPTVDGLIGALNGGTKFSEVSTLKDWIAVGRLGDITPQKMGEIFYAIKSNTSYGEFADALGHALQGQVTCAQILEAASNVPRDVNGICTILIGFAKYCIDKQRANVTFLALNLPPYNLSCVLLYYDPQRI